MGGNKDVDGDEKKDGDDDEEDDEEGEDEEWNQAFILSLFLFLRKHVIY